MTTDCPSVKDAAGPRWGRSVIIDGRPAPALSVRHAEAGGPALIEVAPSQSPNSLRNASGVRASM
jgi:hypothetical protein